MAHKQRKVSEAWRILGEFMALSGPLPPRIFRSLNDLSRLSPGTSLHESRRAFGTQADYELAAP